MDKPLYDWCKVIPHKAKINSKRQHGADERVTLQVHVNTRDFELIKPDLKANNPRYSQMCRRAWVKHWPENKKGVALRVFIEMTELIERMGDGAGRGWICVYDKILDGLPGLVDRQIRDAFTDLEEMGAIWYYRGLPSRRKTDTTFPVIILRPPPNEPLEQAAWRNISSNKTSDDYAEELAGGEPK